MCTDYELRIFDESLDLHGVVNLYNSVFGPLRPFYSWPITVERFRDKVLEHWEFRKEGLWLAFDRDKLVGFILANFRSLSLTELDEQNPERKPAFVSVIAVDPHYRRRGIGRALCEKAATFARDNGRTSLLVSTNPMAPMAFCIGVQEDWHEAHRFLSCVGFSFTGLDQNMVRSIVEYEPDESTKKRIAELDAEGCECRSYEERDYPALVKLLSEGSKWPYWDLDLLSKVGKWTKTRPFMETCFLDCSTEDIYGPDEIGVVMKAGEMLSFCVQTLSPRKKMAYLGPMLTSPRARNQGLGTVSLQISLRQAARKGAVLCDLWTGFDAHRTHFYQKSGFEHVMKWFMYEMKLTR